MTNTEKIRILNEMRKLIESGNANGFCSAYKKTMGEGGIQSLDELGLTRPRDTFDAAFWFKPFDKEPRLKMIDEALAKLTTFKVGDRVRKIANRVSGMFKIGEEVTITEVLPTEGYERYHAVNSDGDTQIVYDIELELTTNKTMTPQEKIDQLKAEQETKCKEFADKIAELEKELSKKKTVAEMCEGKDSYRICRDGYIIPERNCYSADGYLSRERAEKELLRIRLTVIADTLNGGLFEPDYGVKRFFLTFSQSSGKIKAEMYETMLIGGVCFKTAELAEQAMTYFTQDELIKMLK